MPSPPRPALHVCSLFDPPRLSRTSSSDRPCPRLRLLQRLRPTHRRVLVDELSRAAKFDIDFPGEILRIDIFEDRHFPE